ncbi:MAG: hypothetical protein FWG11_09710, partial [Promicromonosporaceae bacterium]|nr:hypothetical protein [Promicromonosporaceae bacterium]
SIPGGGSPVLHLVNPGATAATVTLTPLPGGDPQQATVPSDGQVSVSVRSQASYSLSGVQGLLASVSLTSDAASSSFSLNPPGPLAQPITVYPR